jgi:hypothetical protein
MVGTRLESGCLRAPRGVIRIRRCVMSSNGRPKQTCVVRFTSLLAIVESAKEKEFCHDNAATPVQALDEVSNSDKRRFEARIDDPRRQWNLCHSARRRYDYPRARVITVKRTPRASHLGTSSDRTASGRHA